MRTARRVDASDGASDMHRGPSGYLGQVRPKVDDCLSRIIVVEKSTRLARKQGTLLATVLGPPWVRRGFPALTRTALQLELYLRRHVRARCDGRTIQWKRASRAANACRSIALRRF